MRIASRLVIFVALAAVVPLALATVAVVNVTERAVTEAILRAEVTTAQGVADGVATHLGDVTGGLRRQLANFRLEVATDEAREAFVVATWRAHPSVAALALVDPGGTELVAPVHAGVLGGDRAQLTPHEVESFRAGLPAVSVPGEVAFGPPRGARVPLALASPRDEGVVLVAELALDALGDRLAAFGAGSRAIAVYDGEGRVLADAGDSGLLETDRLRGMLRSPSADYRYTTRQGVPVLAASARVPAVDGVDLGWSVLVAEPASQVGVTGEAIRGRAAYIGGAATVFAVVAGFLFAGALTMPIRRLREATEAFGSGELRYRVNISGGGELAELGNAFNTMSAALAESRHAVERFNEQLQERVEERTQALRAAQADLVRAGRLAAVAELSGGLAHELNNPLSAVIGAVQVVRARGAADPLLEIAETEALRCRDLAADLLRLTQPRVDDPAAPVDLAQVAREALALVQPTLAARGTSTEPDALARGETVTAWVLAPRDTLLQGIAQLVAAARDVAAPASLLTVGLTDAGGRACLTVSLTRVRPDADGWRAAGLGGWMARQLLAPGEVDIPAGPSDPPRWSLSLPLLHAGQERATG